MPLAETYTELTEAYEKVTSGSGITAARQFHNQAGTTSLPEVGDVLNSANPTVYCTSVKEKYWGGHPDKKIYLVTYSTRNRSRGSGATGDYFDDEEADPDTFPITGNLSGELLAIDGPGSGYTWSAGAVIGQQIYKKIITGSFTITKHVSNLLLDIWAKWNGRINSEKFHDIAATFVLFEGVSYEEGYNDVGTKYWTVNFNFSHKRSVDGSDYRGWNYLYNELTNAWDYTDPLLYDNGDFNELLLGHSP